MTADEIEQIGRVLEPGVREAVREVLKSELVDIVARIAVLEREQATLKAGQGKMFGIWTIIVAILTFAAKGLYDLFSVKFLHKS